MIGLKNNLKIIVKESTGKSVSQIFKEQLANVVREYKIEINNDTVNNIPLLAMQNYEYYTKWFV